MKKISLLLIVLGLTASTTYAQQIPLYSNYFFTPYIYNPAMSGTDGVTEATLLHRRQWSGIQGSPETSALALNGSLNDQNVGWSVYGFNDKTDILSRQALYGNYAYHLQLSQSSQLSFGLGAGYLNQNIDQSGVRARDPGDFLTVIPRNRGTFDVNAGLNLQIQNFQIGASANQLVGQPVRYSSQSDDVNIDYRLIRHFLFTSQYDFKFGGDKQILSPMVMVRAAENVPVQIDAGMLFNLVEYGYVGAMFRSDYAVTANLGLHLNDQLTVGYAYDFSTNTYASQFGTSHEFMLTYRFGSNRGNERLENELKRLKRDQRRQRDEVEDIVNDRMEELKDSYRDDIRSEMEEAREEMKRDSEQQGGSGTRDSRSRDGGQGSQQQGGQSGQGGQTSDRGGRQQQGGGSGRSQQNDGGNGGYDASNQASNVDPGSPGYYVTAGVYSKRANAEQQVNKLKSQGFNARFFQDSGNNFFYVYLLKFDTYQEADQAKSSRLNGDYQGELWVKIVE